VIGEYFQSAEKMINDAYQGIVSPSILLKDMTDETQLSLNRYIRIGNGVYAVVFGPPGTGKTSFVDTHYVLNNILARIYDQSLRENQIEGARKRLKIIYRCMERPPEDKMVRFIAYLLYFKHRQVIDVPTLLQHTNAKRKLNEQDIDRIKGLQPTIEQMSRYVDMIGGMATPREVKQYLLQEIYKVGAYFKSTMTELYRNGEKVMDFKKEDMKQDEYGKSFIEVRSNREGVAPFKMYQSSSKYIPAAKDQIILQVVDTINQLQAEDDSRESDLDVLNKHSKNNVEIRDTKAACFIDVAQMGRDSDKALSGKNSAMHLTLKDIKGSGNMGQNADVVLSILDPMYFDATKWGDDIGEYDLERLYGTFRLFQVVKNSHGGNIYKMPCIFLGENGYFKELPHRSKMTEEVYAELNRKYHAEHLQKELRSDLPTQPDLF
jgi:hypothetical protein